MEIAQTGTTTKALTGLAIALTFISACPVLAVSKEQEDGELALTRVQRAGFKCEGKFDFYHRQLFDSVVCSGKQYKIRQEGKNLIVWSEASLFSSYISKTIPLELALQEKLDRENSEKFAIDSEYDKRQRQDASAIIPFEESAIAFLPAWDTRIDLLRAVAAVASYQVRCNSITQITTDGPASAKVICDHGRHIYRVEFLQNRAFVYVVYSRD